VSSKPETTFYTAVHRHLHPRLHREKMFNPYRGGTWDFWFSGKAADLWIEYKFVVLPKRGSTLISADLSALQVDWGKNRIAEGRNIAVVVGCKEGGVILLDEHWTEPMACEEFKARILNRASIAAWITTQTGGPP
jgi:hypothetical protein